MCNTPGWIQVQDARPSGRWGESVSRSVVSDSLQPHKFYMGFSRPEHWSGKPFPSPGDLPNPGIKPRSPTLQMILYQLSNKGSPRILECCSLSLLQQIFLIQESHQGLLHCKWILYLLSYQGSPWAKLRKVIYCILWFLSLENLCSSSFSKNTSHK